MTLKTGRIFVTGAAGMIGSNLCRSLLEDGYQVIGIDNLWRGNRDNMAELEGHANFHFRHADIVADHDWYIDLDEECVLFHTADIVAGIGYVFSNEWRIFQKNLLINTQIARIVNQRQPRQLIYLGTACSYPQGLQRSVEESQLNENLKFPADPESGYGWSKLVGEVEFQLAVQGTNTRLMTLDLHNVYGWPCAYADNTSQVIPSLINKAITSPDGKLVVWGDGSQGRAFLHVRDVVRGASKAIDYSGPHNNIMLGPDHCTTIRELAELIQGHPAVQIDELVFDTSKPTGDVGRFADPTRAKDELGWEPQVPFHDGLFELIDRIIDDSRANRVSAHAD